MAVSVGNNQTFRLRELREEAVGREKSEVRAPSRRSRRFEEALTNDKAGEVVGRFPASFDRAPPRPAVSRRTTLEVAKQRQQPRSAVAALMAREGLSTFTKLGRQALNDETAPTQPPKTERSWMQLAEPNTRPTWMQSSLASKKEELRMAAKFGRGLDGYSMLERAMKGNDARILKEAGKLERAMQAPKPQPMAGSSPAHASLMEAMKVEAGLNHQLNLQYLAIQDKLERSKMQLLSNLLKVRSETVKNSISGAG